MTTLTVTLMGDLSDGSRSPVAGSLTFAPSGWLTDAVSTVYPPKPITIPLDGDGAFSVSLLATDNTEPAPGWRWNVRIAVAGTPVKLYSFDLNHADGAEQDLATLIQIPPADLTGSYDAGGDLTGTYPDPVVARVNGVAMTGTPSAGQVQIATGPAAAHWADLPETDLPMTTLGDTLYQGSSAPARLAGSTSATKQFLTQTGSGSASAAPAWGTIQAADVPTLNQNTTGTAAGLSGVLGTAHGGTGSSSQNFCPLLTMTPVKTSGYSASPGDYVRADATSGSVTITLPAAPADLASVGVKMTGVSGANTVTVQCQGSDVLNKSGGPSSAVLKILNQGAIFQYNAAGAIWLVMADSVSLDQLDSRYLASTALTADLLLAGGSSGGVQQVASAGTSGQVLTSNGPGALPSFQTGTGGGGFSNPMTTVGDVLVEGSGPAAARLAGNTSGTKQFLTSTGSGGVATVPAWGAISSGDVPTLNQNTTGTAAGLSTPLVPASGGTGATSLTGLVVGNGTSTMTAVTAPSGAVVGTTDTQTLTSKRISPRVATLTVSGSTYTPAGDTTDLALIASPTADFTVAAPSGTPVDGQKLLLRITSSGTGRTPTWNSAYLSSGAATLPAAALPASKTVTLGFIWDASASKWVLLALDGTGY